MKKQGLMIRRNQVLGELDMALMLPMTSDAPLRIYWTKV